MNREHPEFLDGPASDLKHTRLGHLLLHWVLDDEDAVRAWISAGADPAVIWRAVSWASETLDRLRYLEDEGFGPVLVVGPLSTSGGSGVGWKVYSWPDAARRVGDFRVEGDRAELDAVLEQDDLIDATAVQAGPLPDDLAGFLARELSQDDEAYEQLVDESPWGAGLGT